MKFLVAFGLALVLRLALSPGPGFPIDIATFQDWSLALAREGPRALYADTSGVRFPVVDYPPGYLLVLWPLGKLMLALHLTSSQLAMRVAIKLPAIVADLGVAALAYEIGRRVVSAGRAFLALCLVLFAPPFGLVSAYWGQVDSVAACVLLLAILAALGGNPVGSFAALTLAALIKPQALVVAPLFAIWHARAGDWAPGRLAGAVAACAAITYAVATPFAPPGNPAQTFVWLVRRYASGYGKYPNASSGAFNLYTVVGRFYQTDAARLLGLSLRAWGIVLFALVVLAACVTLWRAAGPDRCKAQRAFLVANAVVLSGLFVVTTRQHERYLLSALAVGSVVALFSMPFAAVFASLALTFTVNCAFILAGFYGGSHHPITLLVGHLLSLVNVCAFAALFVLFLRGAGERPWGRPSSRWRAMPGGAPVR